MLRKLVTFVFTLAISILWLSYPAYASASNDVNVNSISNDLYAVSNFAPKELPKHLSKYALQSSEFIKRCLLGQANNGLDEISCNVLKQSIQAGIVVAVCYTAEGLAISVFPPIGTLGPACNYLGIAKAGQKMIAQ